MVYVRNIEKGSSGRMLKMYNRLPAKHLKAFNKNRSWFSHKNNFSTDWLFAWLLWESVGFHTRVRLDAIPLLKTSQLRFKITVKFNRQYLSQECFAESCPRCWRETKAILPSVSLQLAWRNRPGGHLPVTQARKLWVAHIKSAVGVQRGEQLFSASFSSWALQNG